MSKTISINQPVTSHIAGLLDSHRIRNAHGEPCLDAEDIRLWFTDEGTIHASAEELSDLGLNLDDLELAVDAGMDIRFFSDVLATGQYEVDDLNAMVGRYLLEGDSALVDAEILLLKASFVDVSGFDQFATAA